MSIRYHYGDTSPVLATVATAKAASLFDIVGLSSNTLVKASDTAWDTDLATTQTAFALLFLGISAQSKTADVAGVAGNSVDNQIRVDTAGVFEFPCASATFEIGDFVGPAKATGNALEDQKVVKVADAAKAIGRVVERGTSVTFVKFKVLSKLLPAAY